MDICTIYFGKGVRKVAGHKKDRIIVSCLYKVNTSFVLPFNR